MLHTEFFAIWRWFLNRLLPKPAQARLYDLGAALLFFGALAQQVELQKTADLALSELAAQGYQIPSDAEPLKIFPALTAGDFSSQHAGAWWPGAIYLRYPVPPPFDVKVYLRHEIFHEVSYRSCGGKLPLWAEEAGAMRFSGELNHVDAGAWPDEAELQGLKNHIQQGAELNSSDRRLLQRLLVDNDWPSQPCTVSAKLQTLLANTPQSSASSAYLLINLVSGRILESSGDQNQAFPPGSLLKIPYAAALNQASPAAIAEELANSDTEKLLNRKAAVQGELHHLLLSAIKHNLAVDHPQQLQDWRVYLGERAVDGSFPIQANLPELAFTLRAALLAKPDYFRGLTQNGFTPSSTLAKQNPADKQGLQRLQALSKTGTVSTAKGQVLVGHLMLAWPAEHPVYLAIFRQAETKGAAILASAAKSLKTWQQRYPVNWATVRVRLLTPAPRDSWQPIADCPELSSGLAHFTLCGQYRIIANSKNSRSERRVNGVLYQPADQKALVLETDLASYVEAVVSAEAEQLTGQAREAMIAVVAWNARHGNHRHIETNALCDTTHCMVFLGQDVDKKPLATLKINAELLAWLDQLAQRQHLNWLSFANGGDQAWQKQLSTEQIATAFKESQILEIRRERRKDQQIFVHLLYADSEETISCEVFRNSLKLPSCPDAISRLPEQPLWSFQGIGVGHGLGLSLLQAQALAEQGYTAKQILHDAYH
jgi:hypothetical protein